MRRTVTTAKLPVADVVSWTKVLRNKYYIGSQDRVKRDEAIVTGSSMVDVEPRGGGSSSSRSTFWRTSWAAAALAQRRAWRCSANDSGSGAGKAHTGATSSSTASCSCAASG